MDFFILVVAGSLIGTVASMIGVGGGIFMVPLLSFFYVGTTQEAVGTSLATVVVTSVFSSINYGRRKLIDFKLGPMLMPTVIAGAWLGAWLTQFISSHGLALAFGVLLLYPATIMLLGREPKEIAKLLGGEAGEQPARYPPLKTVSIGVVAGVASGFFGVGSGILMVPAMSILLKVEMLQAVATSLFVMGPSALLGSAQHAVLGNVHAEFMLPLALGIVLGAQAGPRLALTLPRVRLRQAFGLALSYASLNMIWKGLSQLFS